MARYVEIKATDKWIKRDRATGEPVEMSGATSSRQFQLRRVKEQQDLELELRDSKVCTRERGSGTCSDVQVQWVLS